MTARAVSEGGGGIRGLGIWRYQTATGPSPTAGRLQFDNVTIDSATNLYINVTNDGGTDMSAFLALIASGNLIYIQVQDDSTQFVVCEVGTPSLSAGVYTFPLTTVEGQGAAPTNNTRTAVVTGSIGAGAAAVTLQSAFDNGNTMDSTTQGVAVPDMTEAERDLIGAPTAGELIFNTTTSQLNQYTGATWTVPGAGLTTLQGAYDNSGGANPMIQLALADGTFTIRDDATPLANMFALQNNAGTAFFELDAATISYGLTGNRGYLFSLDPTGRESIEFLPDGRTQTTVAANTGYMMYWDSLVVSDVPGGAPFGNDTAPAGLGMLGECRFDDPGGVFSSALTFNQALTMTANGVNVGPAYTMVNQPTLRTGTLGGSRTFSQANAVRSQLKVGPNVAGNVTLTSHEPFFATIAVDATVGTAVCTTVNYFAAKAPTLTAGGLVTTLNCLDIPNIPAAGITNLRGINSAMNSGLFINHTGSALSSFGGSIQIDADLFGLILGASQDITLGWGAAGFMFWQFNGSTDQIRWDNPATNRYTVQTENGDADGEINFGFERFSFGQIGAVGNQVGVFVAPTRSVGIGGEWSDFLLTQAGNITVNAAMGLVAGWTINAPSITLGTGTVTDAGALNIGGNVNQGSVNRFGVRILSNPSGGSGVNAALWVTAGLSRFDGVVDINAPIALGAGGTATLGTVGGSGPTATAQAQWVQIDINGVTHWIPAWT